MKKLICVILCLVHVFPGLVRAGLPSDSETSSGVTPAREIRLWRPVAWLKDYLLNANKRNDRPFDCSVLLGPSYNSTMSFCLSGGMNGSYSWDRRDTTLHKSDITLFLTASVTGMAKVGVEGRNYMPHDRQRWEYQLKLELLPLHFWGLGYTEGANNANKGSYDQLKLSFRPNYLFRVAPDFYVGPQLHLQYAHTYNFSDLSKLLGQHRDIGSYGGGIVLQYDSRDFAPNAYSGHLLSVEQMFFPKFANQYDFNATELTFDTYHRVWKGGILAIDLHARFQYGEVPWTMYSLVGCEGRMRGYYEGRYRDRDILEGQMELRQHLYGRFGVAIFAGAANVFHDVDHIYWHHTLPNYGLGLRWEFKKRVNVRLDFGLTKNKPGFEFKLNEAF